MSAPYGVIWAIVDGLSDVGVARYNSLTPMQVARMPVMDRLTSAAVTGQHDPVRPGLACGSDAAHLQMFGYDSRAVYRGRGAFETIGAGLPMETGDVAFKCNFATMDPDGSGVVVKRCAGHDFHEAARALCADLDGLPLPSFPDVKVKVRHAGGHRLVVSLSGEGISDKISNTDPLSDGLPLGVIEATAATAAARQTAEIANEVSAEFRRVLETHPVNARRRAEGKSVTDVVLLRGAAEQIELVPFEKATGLKAFLIAPTKIIAGIGSTAGMHIVKAPGATAGYDSDLGSKFSTCLTEMNRKAAAGSREYLYEMGIVHIKAVDEAGHDRDICKKVEMLELFDTVMGTFLQQAYASARGKLILVVTGDHSTSPDYGDHTCEPVPILFADISHEEHQEQSMLTPDAADKFDELTIGTHGSLGRFPSSEIIPLIQNLVKGPKVVQKAQQKLVQKYVLSGN